VEVEMPKGKVKKYSPDQGYGVIVDSDKGQQLSVYGNDVNLKEGAFLAEGQDVEYEIETKRKENWAVNVRAA
jgi:cold shock CspA family protein